MTFDYLYSDLKCCILWMSVSMSGRACSVISNPVIGASFFNLLLHSLDFRTLNCCLLVSWISIKRKLIGFGAMLPASARLNGRDGLGDVTIMPQLSNTQHFIHGSVLVYCNCFPLRNLLSVELILCTAILSSVFHLGMNGRPAVMNHAKAKSLA